MKLTKFTNLLVLGLLLTVAVSGCKKKPGAITPLPAGARAGVTDLETSPPLTGVPSTTSDDALKSMTDGIASIDPSKFKDWTPDRATLQAQMVFFDFDSSVVRGSERSKVAAVADYMKANAGNAVRVEGHCDERGTEEYNRALGDRRAQALREALVSLGVESGRIDTVSFGKDQPLDPEHNEAAWRKNRRGEFIVLTPPNR